MEIEKIREVAERSNEDTGEQEEEKNTLESV